MKKLHEYFERTYLINLDRRPDRLESVTKRCNDLGIKFHRVSAIDGKETKIEITNPSYYWSESAAALSLTFLKILKKCREDDVESVLLLEDDVEFHPDIHIALEKWFDDVPSDWEMIYLGGNHNKPIVKITDNVFRCSRTYATHCYGVHKSAYDIIINELSRFDNPVDWKYGNMIHPRGKSYVFRPHVAYQTEDFSDIINKKVDYKFLKK